MRKTKRFTFVVSCLISSLIIFGCANVFESTADKDSDEAKFENAQKSMNDEDWDAALEYFDAMSSSFQSKSDVIEAWAGAYAGKCGLDFISYFTDLTSASLSTTTIFQYLMNAWTQEQIYPQYCTLAHAKLEEISTSSSDRTTSQNVFLAILGMVKVGVNLRYYADTDGTDGLGDGTPDAAVNVCTDNATNLPQAALDEIITGMGLVMTNLTDLSTALGAGDLTSALSSLSTACGLSAGACTRTSTSSIVAADRDLFRDLLNTAQTNPSTAVGIGACVNPVVTACCP